MSTRFLITSLPRSRTAWMAAFLTAHGAPCLHEPEITIPNLSDLRRVFDLGWNGISDPSAYAKWPQQIDKEFAGKPTLVIRRNSEEAKAAFEEFIGVPAAQWSILEESLEKFVANFKPMEIRFDAMDDPDVMDLVVKHLTGSPMNRRTFSLFRDLKIQQHIEKARAAHERIHHHPG